MQVDCASRGWFGTLPAGAQMTPLTPSVLLLLGTLLTSVLVFRRREAHPRTTTVALAVVLAAVAVFDVVQESVAVLAVLGLGIAWVANGVRRSPDDTSPDALVARAELCARSAVPIALVLLTVFAFTNSLTSTAPFAQDGPPRALWFEPILLLVSIVAGYLAQAGLFLLVYPLLPGRTGYVKALAFGGYLLVLFLLGVGADERLIVSLPQLAIGRAVYYLSVPVLLGVYLDLKQRSLGRTSGASGAAADPGPDTKTYFERMRAQINLVGGVASILAPPIYAAITRSSVVSSYFSLLDQLARAA
jgi:hypothetical protein